MVMSMMSVAKMAGRKLGEQWSDILAKVHVAKIMAGRQWGDNMAI